MRINWLNIWIGGSAVLLVGTDALAVTEAAAWALSGLAGLAPPLAIALYALAGGLALSATFAFARMVHGVDPFFGSISQPPERETGAGGAE